MGERRSKKQERLLKDTTWYNTRKYLTWFTAVSGGFKGGSTRWSDALTLAAISASMSFFLFAMSTSLSLTLDSYGSRNPVRMSRRGEPKTKEGRKGRKKGVRRKTYTRMAPSTRREASSLTRVQQYHSKVGYPLEESGTMNKNYISKAGESSNLVRLLFFVRVRRHTASQPATHLALAIFGCSPLSVFLQGPHTMAINVNSY